MPAREYQHLHGSISAGRPQGSTGTCHEVPVAAIVRIIVKYVQLFKIKLDSLNCWCICHDDNRSLDDLYERGLSTVEINIIFFQIQKF